MGVSVSWDQESPSSVSWTEQTILQEFGFLLQENGDFLLQEDGGYIILDIANVIAWEEEDPIAVVWVEA